MKWEASVPNLPNLPGMPDTGGTPGVSRERSFPQGAPMPASSDSAPVGPESMKEARREEGPRIRPWLNALPILSGGAASSSRPAKRGAPPSAERDGQDGAPDGIASRPVAQAPGALRAYRRPASPSGGGVETGRAGQASRRGTATPVEPDPAQEPNPLRAVSRELVARGMPGALVADLLAETVAEYGSQVLTSERDARLALVDVLLSRIPTTSLVRSKGAVTLPPTGTFLVTGPAGAGKSVLIAHLALMAARAGQTDVVLINTQAERIGAAAQMTALGAVFGYDVEHLYTPTELRTLMKKRGKKALLLVETGGWTPAPTPEPWSWPWQIRGATVVTCVPATGQCDDVKEALMATREAAGDTVAVLCKTAETRNVLPAIGALATLRQTVAMVAPGPNLVDPLPAPELAAVVKTAICGAAGEEAKGALP